MRRWWKLTCRGLLLLLGINFLVVAWVQWGVIQRVVGEGTVRSAVMLGVGDGGGGRQPLLATTGPDGQRLTLSAITIYGPGMAPAKGAPVTIYLLAEQPPLAVIDSFWGRYGTVILYGLLGGMGLVAGLMPPRRSEAGEG